jgi:hypothetical protein
VLSLFPDRVHTNDESARPIKSPTERTGMAIRKVWKTLEIPLRVRFVSACIPNDWERPIERAPGIWLDIDFFLIKRGQREC